MKTEIIIDGYRHDETNGHVSVLVHARTVEGNSSWDGPKHTYGVDAIAFAHRFNSDIEQFESWIISQHRHKLGVHEKLMEALGKRKGKVIGVIDHGGVELGRPAGDDEGLRQSAKP